MAKMVRKQVYLGASHDRLLKERARQYRVTEAELIRAAIDRGIGPGPTPAPDPAAWKEVEAFLARRRRKRVPRQRRRWRREDLYER